MSKILEKALKDALKEDKNTMGAKQVLNSVKNSKLVVLSQSVEKEMCEKIESDAKKEKIPFVNFQGTSVAPVTFWNRDIIRICSVVSLIDCVIKKS